MKKILLALTLLSLATPALADHLAIVGQRMKIHAVRPDEQSSPRRIWPLVRFRYTGSEPRRVKLGWQILNGNGAEITRVEKTHWVQPGQLLTVDGPDFYEYSNAQLKLRGYATDMHGAVLVERISVPAAQR